jgi:hypothetical protein
MTELILLLENTINININYVLKTPLKEIFSFFNKIDIKIIHNLPEHCWHASRSQMNAECLLDHIITTKVKD